MESFVEERLDLGILYGTDGGPGFSTRIIASASGHEWRNIDWEEERGRWELGDRDMLRSTLEYIHKFFRARRGKAIGFRWKNWADYVLSNETIGTGDDATVDFQIIQTSDTGYGTPYVRNIRKPVGGTVNVYIDDVQQLSGWTVDTTTGIVTFAAAPAAGEVISVSCEFDIPVRFDIDELPNRFDAYRSTDDEVVYYLPPLPIVEERL
jgi:uncharacterized protein (TIGR02217 family)